jgi:hypothetical protein
MAYGVMEDGEKMASFAEVLIILHSVVISTEGVIRI